MIPAFLRIRTMGVSITDVRPELIFMMIQMIIYFLLAVLAYKISVIRQERKHQARLAALISKDK
jgi:ABC-2 type transport system permease protein